MDYKCEFDWHGTQGYLNDKERKEVQSNLKKEVNEHCRPCHPGPVTIHLNLEGPLLSGLVGNVRCKCGKPCLEIEGKKNSTGGFDISYNPVEK